MHDVVTSPALGRLTLTLADDIGEANSSSASCLIFLTTSYSAYCSSSSRLTTSLGARATHSSSSVLSSPRLRKWRTDLRKCQHLSSSTDYLRDPAWASVTPPSPLHRYPPPKSAPTLLSPLLLPPVALSPLPGHTNNKRPLPRHPDPTTTSPR
jgi:hypothetical protein